MPADELDQAVRLAAFRFLEEELAKTGDELLSWRTLSRGFDFRGRRVPLVSQQGIFKPAILDLVPLTIRTTPPKPHEPPPYRDTIRDDGLIEYRFRGADPAHRENVGLRTAMLERHPLVYLFGVVQGQYIASWPVFVVGETPDPTEPSFTIQVDDPSLLHEVSRQADTVGESDDAKFARRAYITASVRRRIHQRSFRERVLQAYRDRCAVCRLRHRELLDASHIVPDSEPGGEPVVANGLALCKLHHAAFDREFLGIRPDLRIEIRPEILDERDGPMLLHGLKGFHGSRITVPRSKDLRPGERFLAQRYAAFRAK